jgi:hypothetical protein
MIFVMSITILPYGRHNSHTAPWMAENASLGNAYLARDCWTPQQVLQVQPHELHPQLLQLWQQQQGLLPTRLTLLML